MKFEEWESATNPKIKGSWNLHVMLPQDMDFFLFLSSVSGIFGNGSQANYAAGSTYLDALAHYRVRHGQKAVSINLGWVEFAGAVHGSDLLMHGMKAASYAIPVTEVHFLAILDKYCDAGLDIGSQVQLAVGLKTSAGIRAKKAEVPQWMDRQLFIHLDQLELSAGTQPDAPTNTIDYSALFPTLGSLAEAAQIVTEGLVKKISSATLISIKDIDTSKALYEYGVDSLLAVEIRSWFSRELSANVTVFDIMGAVNFDKLSTLAVQESLFKQSIWGDKKT